MVQAPSHPQAMPLSDAIALSNLELFIQGEKWYEMLPLLFLSQVGKHFIVLKHPDLSLALLLLLLHLSKIGPFMILGSATRRSLVTNSGITAFLVMATPNSRVYSYLHHLHC